MNNVIEFPNTDNDKYAISYISDDGKVIGCAHPSWGFRIQFKDDIAAFVDDDNDEPFGELPLKHFTTVLMAFLLIAQPDLIDAACSKCNGDTE